MRIPKKWIQKRSLQKTQTIEIERSLKSINIHIYMCIVVEDTTAARVETWLKMLRRRWKTNSSQLLRYLHSLLLLEIKVTHRRPLLANNCYYYFTTIGGSLFSFIDEELTDRATSRNNHAEKGFCYS